MAPSGRSWINLSLLCGMLLLTAACSSPPSPGNSIAPAGYSERVTRAIGEVQKLQASGRRVWCVPFARNVSGIELRGNAGTWWGKASNIYPRGREPQVGAVMAFSSTRRNPNGHLAVVSEVVTPRQVLIDHANWERNRVSLKMAVVDISDKNDWSAVRVESVPGSLGSVYPLDGFIYPSKLK